ncbi:MAG: sugar ABC transporter permease [Sphaerochaeta sp.]|nr:sugar ABC transporter permease [Sphaerochaeta sp.]
MKRIRIQSGENKLSFRQGRYKKDELLTAFFFLLPMFAIFFIFKYIPLLDNFRISLTSWNLFSPKKRFIGLANFKAILTSAIFWKILGNTFFFTFWSTAFSMVLGFFIAVTLHKRTSLASKILKTVFFIPNITTASAVAILWIWIFDPDYGLAGQLFNLIGKQSPRWLLTPGYAIWIVISLAVWRSVGYVMLIYSSGLSGISDDVYEAATIDGASPWQQTTRITLPLLKPTTYFLLLTSFIQAMQVFDIVSVMTGGGPYNSTNVLNLYIYQEAFARAHAGYASALSVFLFLILLFFTVVQRTLSRDKGEANA